MPYRANHNIFSTTPTLQGYLLNVIQFQTEEIAAFQQRKTPQEFPVNNLRFQPEDVRGKLHSSLEELRRSFPIPCQLRKS